MSANLLQFGPNEHWWKRVKLIIGGILSLELHLEQVFCKKRQKNSPNQETSLENRGHLKVQNDVKLVLKEHE